MNFRKIPLTHGTGAIPTIGLGTWTVLGQQVCKVNSKVNNEHFLLPSFRTTFMYG